MFVFYKNEKFLRKNHQNILPLKKLAVLLHSLSRKKNERASLHDIITYSTREKCSQIALGQFGVNEQSLSIQIRFGEVLRSE